MKFNFILIHFIEIIANVLERLFICKLQIIIKQLRLKHPLKRELHAKNVDTFGVLMFKKDICIIPTFDCSIS